MCETKNKYNLLHSTMALLKRMEQKLTLFESQEIENIHFLPFDIMKIPDERLKKQYINYTNGLPIAIFEEYNINENKTKQEPLSKVLEFLKEKYFLEEWQCISKIARNNIEVALIIPNTNKNKNLITNEMQHMGYFLAASRTYQYKGMDWIQIQYEPYFSKNLNDEIRLEEHLYHITPSENVSSILSYGIRPTDENMVKGLKWSNRPELVFMLRGYTGPMQWKTLAKALDSRKPEYLKRDTYAVIQVDTKKVPSNIVFQGDPEHTSGICTYSKIPKDCVKHLMDFNINED